MELLSRVFSPPQKLTTGSTIITSTASRYNYFSCIRQNIIIEREALMSNDLSPAIETEHFTAFFRYITQARPTTKVKGAPSITGASSFHLGKVVAFLEIELGSNHNLPKGSVALAVIEHIINHCIFS